MHHLNGNAIPAGHVNPWVILMKFCMVKWFLGLLPWAKPQTYSYCQSLYWNFKPANVSLNVSDVMVIQSTDSIIWLMTTFQSLRTKSYIMFYQLHEFLNQTSEVSVHWRKPSCDDWGMSVLWCCCDSWTSTRPPCTSFCVELATDAAHAVMAGQNNQRWLTVCI